MNKNLKKFHTASTYGVFVSTFGPPGEPAKFDFTESASDYTVWNLPLKPANGGLWGTKFLSETEFPELD